MRRGDLGSARGLLLAGGLLGTLVAGAVFARVALRLLDGPRTTTAPAAPSVAFVPGELRFPVPAAEHRLLADTFREARGGGTRIHEAVDIAAPRHSPVVAVDDGEIERLAETPLGGISLYQRDARGRYCFYYAHLERYADGLAAGQQVRRGQTVGFVGTSGNAPANAPHLHFAVHEAGERSCRGRAVDPLPLLRRPTG